MCLAGYVRFKNICKKILHSIRRLNLFATKTSLDNDEYSVHTQIISTRLFILLLSISLIVLLIYTSQIASTRTITIDSPSLSVYSSLYEEHGEKLTCPCTTVAVAIKNVFTLVPTMHPVCSSVFIDPSWVEGMDESIAGSTIYNRDFRARTPRYFQMLGAFCELASTSLTEAIDQFGESPIISTNVLSEGIFYSRMNASIDLIITSTVSSFVRVLDLLQNSTYGNVLMSATLSSISFYTTADYAFSNNDTSTWQINRRYKTYTYNNITCSCQDTSTCIEPATVYFICWISSLYFVFCTGYADRMLYIQCNFTIRSSFFL